jgi:hypothetical protein
MIGNHIINSKHKFEVAQTFTFTMSLRMASVSNNLPASTSVHKRKTGFTFLKAEDKRRGREGGGGRS